MDLIDTPKNSALVIELFGLKVQSGYQTNSHNEVKYNMSFFANELVISLKDDKKFDGIFPLHHEVVIVGVDPCGITGIPGLHKPS